MVHVFHYQDHYYIFDTGSSSLHECDEKGALLMREKLGEAVDTSCVTPEERAEYEADFAELEKQGLLFKEEVRSRRSACTSVTTATCAAAIALPTRGHTTPSASL